MKTRTILILFTFSLLPLTANAQGRYTTTDSELIFGLSDISRGGNEIDSELRFTMFYHSATYFNHDLSNNFGFFYGLAIRNIGFITRDEVIDQPYSVVKRRSYTLGLPVGIKLGSISDNTFLFLGGEYEWLFHYKEKRFINDEKVFKDTDWFSKRTTTFLPSFFAGITFPKGYSFTFKYYLGDFMDRNYRDGAGNRPYSDMDSRMFYISVSKIFRYDKIESIIKNSDFVL